MQAFPLPRCATCAGQARCDARGTTEPGYPRCHTPLRRTDLARLAQLFGSWRRHHGVDAPAVLALEQALLARLAVDGRVYSEVLEASVSWGAGGFSTYRLSYAFPGFGHDPARTQEELVALAAPFGEAAAELCRRALRSTAHRCVAQPLFGFALDGPGAIRLKLYLQFHPGAGDAPLRVAEQLLGATGLRERLGAAARAPLHLLGLDFDTGGRLGAAKLYLVHPVVKTATIADTIAPSRVVEALAAAGVASLADVLAIYRLEGPGDEGVAAPREIDFALPQSDLLWRAVRALAPLAPICTGASPLAALEQAFRLGVRRLSVSVGDVSKMNVYYVLAEVEQGA